MIGRDRLAAEALSLFESYLSEEGAAVVGFVILRVAFAAYAGVAGQYLAYGFLGAVLLFLLWLYFGALVLLFGAVVNAAVTGGVRAD